MGIIHSFDNARGVVLAVWDAAVTWEDWQEHAGSLIQEPYWLTSSRFIVDLRSVTDTASINDEQVRQAGQLFHENRDVMAGKRGAVIAASEFRHAHDFGSLISATGIAMVVFNSLDTACIFLGLDLFETSRELERLRSQLRGP